MNNGSSPLHWQLCLDPFAESSREILEFASHVLDSGAATILMSPAIAHTEYKAVPEHFNKRFGLAFGSHGFELNNNLEFQLQTPPIWIYQNNQYVVSKIVLYAFVDGANPIKIDTHFKVPLRENGYVQVLLPVGSYALQGTLEDRHFVDSFYPHPRFYRSHESPLSIPRESHVNLLSFVIDISWLEQIKTTVYSVTSNTNASIKLWMADDTKLLSFKNCGNGLSGNGWMSLRCSEMEQIIQHSLLCRFDQQTFI
jgi:hypothetical protein